MSFVRVIVGVLRVILLARLKIGALVALARRDLIKVWDWIFRMQGCHLAAGVTRAVLLTFRRRRA